MWHLLCLPWRLELQSCDGWWWTPADSSSPEGRLCRVAVRLVVLHTTPHLLKGWTWGRYTERLSLKTVDQINTGNQRFSLDCSNPSVTYYIFTVAVSFDWLLLRPCFIRNRDSASILTSDAVFLCWGQWTVPSNVAPLPLPAINKPTNK